jgi:Viral BACON domain
MRGVTAGLLLAGSLIPVYADVVFSDTAFNLSNYANAPSYTANGATTSISQCGGCGDPGSALQAVATFGSGSTPGFADGGIVNTGFVYNPSTQGAIESLTASVDKDESVNGTPNNGAPFTTSFHPMIEQDGKYYIATIPGPGFAGGSTGFLHFSQAGMTASDFTQFDFTTGNYVTGNPNFSGDAMTFGIASLASSSNGIIFTVVDDNLTFDLVTSPVSPELTVAPGVVNFSEAAVSSAASQQTALQQTLVVQNLGSGSVNFTAAVIAGSPWVSISPSSGTAAAGSPVFITVTANAQGLAAGSYRDIIQLFTATEAAAAPVTLFVANPGPILWARPAGVLFPMAQGSASTAPQALLLSNRGSPGSTVNWTVAPATGRGVPNGNFLTFGNQSGQLQAGGITTVPLSLNGNASTLAAGVYYELIEISDKGSQNSPQYVTAVLNVAAAEVGAEPAISPGGLLFIGGVGQAIASQQFRVDSSQTVAVQPAASLPPGQSWLQVTPAQANASSGAPAVMTAAINTSGLPAGVYTGTVTLFGSAASVLGSVNVTLILTPYAVQPDVRGAVRPEVNTAGCTPSALVLTETGVPNNFTVPAGWPANLIATMTDDCGNAIDNGSVVANFSNGDAPL